jgi:hypothetical protein
VLPSLSRAHEIHEKHETPQRGEPKKKTQDDTKKFKPIPIVKDETIPYIAKQWIAILPLRTFTARLIGGRSIRLENIHRQANRGPEHPA